MQNVEVLINSANSLIRTANIDYEDLKKSNSVTRIKAEKNLKDTLPRLSSKIQEIQTSVTSLPIHEKPRYTQVLNTLKNEYSRLNSFPKPSPVKAGIELKSVPQADCSSMSQTDLLRHQQELKKKQELDVDALILVAQSTKNTSLEIRDELTLHNNLLDATELNVDRTNERLGALNARLERFINAVDKCQFSCLLIVIILLLVLLLTIIMI